VIADEYRNLNRISIDYAVLDTAALREIYKRLPKHNYSRPRKPPRLPGPTRGDAREPKKCYAIASRCASIHLQIGRASCRERV